MNEVYALEGANLRQLTKHNDKLLVGAAAGDDRGLPVEEQGRHRGART